MHRFPASLTRAIARLLAVVMLLLGMLAPSQSLADTLEDHAPSKCAVLTADRHLAPLMSLTDFDLGDEFADLEQLLQPVALPEVVAAGPGADYPAPPALRLPSAPAPLLRPPAFPA